MSTKVALATLLAILPMTAAVAQEAPPSPPPAGKYVCRQYMTTINYHSMGEDGSYSVSDVTGEYAYDAKTGEVTWLSGKYAEWEYAGVYEHRTAASLGRAEDEHIIRLSDPTGALKIDCFLMAD